MKYLISLLIVSLSTSCASRRDSKPPNTAVLPGTSVSAKRMASVRTPEVVKAYPVGRYTDPNYPDEMHEQHTVYRREQSHDWNYLPDPPPILPTGHPSNASGELNAKQRAYAAALQEQNRAMQKRLDALQQEALKVPGLQIELEEFKKKESQNPQPTPNPVPIPAPSSENPGETDFISDIEPELPAWEERDSYPSDDTLFAESDEQNQDFLMSQMRINDEFSAELAAAERRKFSAAIHAPFLRRRELALLNQ